MVITGKKYGQWYQLKEVDGNTILPLSYLVFLLQSREQHSLFHTQMSVNHPHRQHNRLQLGDHKLKPCTGETVLLYSSVLLLLKLIITPFTQAKWLNTPTITVTAQPKYSTHVILSSEHVWYYLALQVNHLNQGLFQKSCAYLGSIWRCFTCQGPEVVRIQVLPKRVLGCLWDFGTQNTGRGANSDIISVIELWEIKTIRRELNMVATLTTATSPF